MRAMLIFVMLLLPGCMASTATMVASIYSVSESGQSKFDETRWIRIKSIWCDPITFDLYQDTNLYKVNMAAIEINIVGTHSIQAGKSLHLNIDGTFTDLTTLEQLTGIVMKPGYYSSGAYSGISFYLPSYNVSSKRYLVETSLLEKMAKAEKLVMRVDLAREYMDAVCTSEKTSGSDIPAASTSYGIRKFLENAAHVKEP